MKSKEEFLKDIIYYRKQKEAIEKWSGGIVSDYSDKLESIIEEAYANYILTMRTYRYHTKLLYKIETANTDDELYEVYKEYNNLF